MFEVMTWQLDNIQLLSVMDFHFADNEVNSNLSHQKCALNLFWVDPHSPSQCLQSPSTARAWGPHQWGCGHMREA